MLNSRSRHVEGSITAPIAWLSTCLLAGGLGAVADSDTHQLWLRAGCFGLVAAAGLEGVARTRFHYEQARRRRAVQRRCERSLRLFAAERDFDAERKAAIARLLGDRQSPQRPAGTTSEARWGCNLPVEIFPVRRESATVFSETDDEPATGRLINLSNSGFGLQLDGPIARQLVVVSFLRPHEQDFDLLGELLWCDAQPSGEIRAGGRLIRVLAMDPADNVEPLVEASR